MIFNISKELNCHTELSLFRLIGIEVSSFKRSLNVPRQPKTNNRKPTTANKKIRQTRA